MIVVSPDAEPQTLGSGLPVDECQVTVSLPDALLAQYESLPVMPVQGRNVKVPPGLMFISVQLPMGSSHLCDIRFSALAVHGKFAGDDGRSIPIMLPSSLPSQQRATNR
jgi:hypothetical protein